MTGLRVLRIYHAGGDPSHRARERALLDLGVDVTLVVPRGWTEGEIGDVPHLELPARRLGDVNRHAYDDPRSLPALVRRLRPDLVDVHEEPVSVAARQWLRAAVGLPAVMYTAQNLDKRWPPPFAQYERAALRRTDAFYPCSAQAASVLRGKGYRGLLRVLPLGVDPDVHRPGTQALPSQEVVLGLVGRLVPEKGVLDAVRILAHVRRSSPARLLVVGEGPEQPAARVLAQQLGVLQSITWQGWRPEEELAAAYRQMHVVLVPSRSTARWVEQFGRVITEGRAAGAVVAGYASGSIPEVVGDAGVLAAEGDVDGLAATVLQLVREPSTWHRLRRRGLEATARGSWQAVAQQQVALYEEALRTRAPSPRRPTGQQREAAELEFGAPARTPAGSRPFALPLLRRGGRVADALATVVDRGLRQR